jgi:tetratricopeptide (TPR) repeat protein
MHPISILASAVILAGATSFVTIKLVGAGGRDAAPAGLGEEGLAELREGQASLERTLRDLTERLDRLETSEMRAAVPATAPAELAGASTSEAAPAPAQGAAEASAKDHASTVQDLFAQLTAGDLSYEQREAVWRKAREAGAIDDLVEAFEDLAKSQPHVADVQVALGAAYLQKLFTVPDNEKGMLAVQADRAFDAALEIDPNNWPGRFSKAVSLSFWPAFMGKGSEAIKQFEILVDQQESSGTSKPEHAQTYLFLGNLYEQRGQTEEAKKMWQRGYDRFPASKELQERLGSLQEQAGR